jgi:hypothetical protein
VLLVSVAQYLERSALILPFILVRRSEIILYMQMFNLRRDARGINRIRKLFEKFKEIYFRGSLRRTERLLQI